MLTPPPAVMALPVLLSALDFLHNQPCLKDFSNAFCRLIGAMCPLPGLAQESSRYLIPDTDLLYIVNRGLLSPSLILSPCCILRLHRIVLQVSAPRISVPFLERIVGTVGRRFCICILLQFFTPPSPCPDSQLLSMALYGSF